MADGGRVSDVDSSTASCDPQSSMAALGDTSDRGAVTEVLLSGIPASVTHDYLLHYLESLPNLSCDVKNVYRENAENAIVTFEEPIDAVKLQDACNEKALQGQVLKVGQVYRGENVLHTGSTARTLCTRVLLSGVPSSVTDDYLTNFLECNLTECDVKEIRRRSKKDAVVVVFDKPVDTEQLQRVCNDNLVEEQVLKVAQVDHRGAVLVRNPQRETKTNCFLYYFSNPRRTGGSKVVEIYRDEENRFLVVYFNSIKVAETVAGKHHTLEKHELRVELFDPNLDALPCQTGEDCPVTSSTESSIHSSCEDGKSLSSPQFPGAAAEVAPSPVDPGPAADDADSPPGAAEVTQNLGSGKLQDTHPHAVEKVMEGIHNVYLSILDAFSDVIAEQFDGTQITVDNTCVKIEGEQHNVEKLEKLLQILHQRQNSRYIVEVADRFSAWEDIFNDIEEKTAQGDYFLGFQEGLVDGCSEEELCIGLSRSNQQDLLSFDQFLEQHVSKRQVPVDSPAARKLLETTAWEYFLEDEIEDKFGKKIEIITDKSNSRILMLGSAQHLGKAKHCVEQFLQNAQDYRKLQLCSRQVYFLKTFCNKVLESVQFQVGLDNAEIHIDGNVMEIQGCRAGVRRAEKEIRKVLRNLQCRRAVFAHPKLDKIFKTKTWCDVIEDVEKVNRCMIGDFPDPQIRFADDDQEDWGPWSATIIHSYSLLEEQLKCHLVEGCAEDLKVDAVVLCDSKQNVVPTEQLGASSVHGAGARAKSTTRGREHTSGIYVTQSGARPCRSLIRINLQHYFSHKQSASLEDSMKTLISDVFQLCTRCHFTSVAFPVIGVDVPVRGPPEPIDVASKILAKCLTQLCSGDFTHSDQYNQDSLHDRDEKQKSSLRHVCLCSRRAACLRGLTYAFQEWCAWAIQPPLEESFKFLSNITSSGNPNLQNGAISLSKNDIAKTRAHVLVVPLDIDTDLDLNKSKVTKSLLHHGGQDVQHTAQHGTKWLSTCIEIRNEELADRGVVESSCGYLDCRVIFYVYLPPWGPGVKQVLTDRVHKCLHKAAEKKHRSVAMTALGVGKLGYPPEFVARTTVSAVSDFLEKKKTSLENVNFVIFPTDQTTFTAFNMELAEWHRHRVITYDGSEASAGNLHYASDTSQQRSLQTSSSSDPYSYAAVTRRSGHGGGSREGHRRREDRGYTHPQSPQLVYPNPYTEKCQLSVKLGTVKFQVKIGDITLEKCGVVVNGINKDFDFDKGGVPRAFKRRCAQTLLHICNVKGNKNKLKKKGRVITEAPGLPYCNKILHLNLAKFIEKPKDTIKECLQHVRDSDQTCRSLAFPPLGTGVFSPSDAENLVVHMIRAIREVQKPKNLQEVRLVVKDKNLFTHMAAQVKKIVPCPQRQPHNPEHHKLVQSASAKETGERKSPSPSPQAQETPLLTRMQCGPCPPGTDEASLFIFSDSEEHRQAAIDDIASRITTILGPVPQVTSQQGEKDTQHSGGFFNPKSWSLSWNAFTESWGYY